MIMKNDVGHQTLKTRAVFFKEVTLNLVLGTSILLLHTGTKSAQYSSEE